MLDLLLMKEHRASLKLNLDDKTGKCLGCLEVCGLVGIYLHVKHILIFNISLNCSDQFKDVIRTKRESSR